MCGPHAAGMKRLKTKYFFECVDMTGDSRRSWLNRHQMEMDYFNGANSCEF